MSQTYTPLLPRCTAASAGLPDVSTEQRASNELNQLIRKLRWMGMEEEIVKVQKTLSRYPALPAYGVIGGPVDTD
jgi:hypothetical protein